MPGGPALSFEVAEAWVEKQDASDWEDSSIYEKLALSGSLEQMRFSPLVSENLKLLSEVPKEKATVLDYGCAAGLYSYFLSREPATTDWSYVGVDVSLASISAARKLFPSRCFVLIDPGPRIPFLDSSVDVTLASGVLQYIRDWPVALGELGRVSDWIAVTRTPVLWTSPSVIARQTVTMGNHKEQHHLHLLSIDDLRDVAKGIGLKIVLLTPGSEQIRVPGIPENVKFWNLLLRQDACGPSIGLPP